MMKRSSNGQAASDRQTGSGDGLIDLMRRFHTPRLLFKEGPIYEQSAARTLREQQEKQSCRWSRQPLKI
jgi:hypothetical protein